MKTDYKLKQCLPDVGKGIVEYNSLWANLLTFTAILLNLVIITSFSEENGSRLDSPKFFGLSIPATKALLFIIGILTFILWIFIFFPVVIKKFSKVIYRYQVEYEKLKEKFERDQVALEETSKFTQKRSIWEWIKHSVSIVWAILRDVKVVFYTVCGFSIILGLFDSPLWHVILIIHIVITSTTMKNLLRAIYEPGSQIIRTIVLMFIIMYLFVVIAYKYFETDYPDDSCYSIWSCFVISFDQTLKASGLGNYLEAAYEFTGERVDIEYFRVLFDNLEFFLNFTLMIAIISGIIIDKFNEARQKKDEIHQDEISSCFICGKQSKDFDLNLKKADFKTHVKIEHNIWDYVYFIAYLRFLEEEKSQNITFVERYVLEKLNQNDNSWFPCYAQEYNEED